jgi:hypothetical protein
METMQRFWSKVDKAGAGGCWLWTANRFENGYGMYSTRTTKTMCKTWKAHRLAWTLVHGPVPEGMSVLHRCDVKRCANPSHLFLGTTADNMADKVAKGRQARGERHGRAKVTVRDVPYIRGLRAIGFTYSELGKMYGLNQSTIGGIINRRIWKEVPDELVG